MLASALVIAGGGLLNLLVVLLVAGIVAAVAYWILGLFLPHPIPALIAAAIVVIALLQAL